MEGMDRRQMPTPRKHANNAERQAAYRSRRSLRSQSQLITQIPASEGSQVSSKPSYRQWRAKIVEARSLIESIKEQMELYYDERSEQWQQSEQGEKHSETMELIEEIVSLMQDLS